MQAHRLVFIAYPCHFINQNDIGVHHAAVVESRPYTGAAGDFPLRLCRKVKLYVAGMITHKSHETRVGNGMAVPRPEIMRTSGTPQFLLPPDISDRQRRIVGPTLRR